MNYKCPGSDARNLQPENVVCPQCGYEVEMFSDEQRAVCPACKAAVTRENLPGCAGWCDAAEQCVGKERLDAAGIDGTKNGNALKERLRLEMRKVFGTDAKRIQHAETVTAYAEQILAQEGGEWNVVTAAGILHDIGIHACERKYNSTDGQLQEQEGPPIAREIMQRLGIKPDVIDEVCAIIGSHHSPGEVETDNFAVIWDADWLVNLEETVPGKSPEQIRKLIERIFKTKTGKKLAKDTFLGGTS